MAPNLPALLVLTDRTQCDGGRLVETVERTVDAGARAIVLREKDVPRDERVTLAATLRPIVHAAGGVLLVASDPTIESDGVHLAAADPFPLDDRPMIVGRSCHTIAEVGAAASEGCDYVTVSPIFATASKPGYGPALGPAALGQMCRSTAVRVFALGGIDSPTRAAACRDAGAAGVAAMGLAMHDPEALRALLPRSADRAVVPTGTGGP
jgi:thiamine-phosphate pyrophosphorylase